VILAGGTLLMAAPAPRSAEPFDDVGFDVLVVNVGQLERSRAA
jgi:hypothetical protein